jgi:thioredoxin reductase
MDSSLVPGAYAAGDIAAPKDQVIVAAASGAQAAIAINGDLVQANWEATASALVDVNERPG